MAARDLHLLALALLVAGASACSTDEITVEPYVVPTEIAVGPADFLGDLVCSPNPGAPQSYVVTLTHYLDGEDVSPFTVGSGLPTPCSLVSGFRHIEIGHRYTADVDVYDLPSDQLRAFGQASSGSRQMIDLDSGDPAVPRWSSHCGGGASSAAVARENQRVFVRPCDEIVDSAPHPAQLTLSPVTILGSDPCATSASLDVVEEDDALPAVVGLPCDAEPLVYDVQDGQSYRLYAVATVGDAVQGTTCFATGRAGQTVTPSCGGLSSRGSIAISLAGLTDAGGQDLLCPAGDFFDVLEAGEALNAVPLPCEVSATIGGLEAGTALLDVVVYDAQGGPLGQATCSATVAPGKTVAAFCLP